MCVICRCRTTTEPPGVLVLLVAAKNYLVDFTTRHDVLSTINNNFHFHRDRNQDFPRRQYPKQSPDTKASLDPPHDLRMQTPRCLASSKTVRPNRPNRLLSPNKQWFTKPQTLGLHILLGPPGVPTFPGLQVSF